MSNYDNSNSGAAFQPFNESKLLLQGKMHIEDKERKIALISDTTRDGRKIIEVYQKVAVLLKKISKATTHGLTMQGQLKITLLKSQ